MGKKENKKLPPDIALEEGGKIVDGETCFGTHKKLNMPCDSQDCRYWKSMCGNYQNCVINAAEEGPFTLQQVGDIFDVTRMRICQIEKSAKQLLKNFVDDKSLC